MILFKPLIICNCLQENVLPLGERPLLVRVGVHYKFSKLVVDRVEAVDGTYDVLFIGTGKVCVVDVFFACFFFF